MQEVSLLDIIALIAFFHLVVWLIAYRLSQYTREALDEYFKDKLK